MDCSLPGSSVHGIFQARITGEVCHFLLQGIFPTQGSNRSLFCLLHWQVHSLPLIQDIYIYIYNDHYYYCSCPGYTYLHSSVALVPPKGGLCGTGVVPGPFRAQLFFLVMLWSGWSTGSCPLCWPLVDSFNWSAELEPQ